MGFRAHHPVEKAAFEPGGNERLPGHALFGHASYAFEANEPILLDLPDDESNLIHVVR